MMKRLLHSDLPGMQKSAHASEYSIADVLLLRQRAVLAPRVRHARAS